MPHKILVMAMLAMPLLGLAQNYPSCSEGLRAAVYELRDSGRLAGNAEILPDSSKISLDMKAICQIGIPIMSDGMRYEVVGVVSSPQFVINVWNGFTGAITTYGPFKSNAYNKPVHPSAVAPAD